MKRCNAYLQELIGIAVCVALLNNLGWVVSLFSLALNQTVNSNLNSLPSLVSVHSVVSPNNGNNLAKVDLLHVCLKILQVAEARFRICITTITKEVNEGFWYVGFFGCLEEGFQVVNVRVDATVRDLKQGHAYLLDCGLSIGL